MKLFIVGNGFDRGHNLPTSYWDFRTYLKNNYPEFLSSFEEYYDIYPRVSNDALKNMLWTQLETNLANLDEDRIIDEGTSIELFLENEDSGIEDTLYDYFRDEFKYIEKLKVYLKRWVRTIRIRDCLPRTTLINAENMDRYVTFNYTAVLENVYHIPSDRVTHIHGSLRNYTPDPVLGHGNIERISNMKNKIKEAEQEFDEKYSSICRILKGYYEETFKDIERYYSCLQPLANENFDEIIVIGHSLAGVDLPYFERIDELTDQNLNWTIYCFNKDEESTKKENLWTAGIDGARIHTLPASEFYDIIR